MHDSPKLIDSHCHLNFNDFGTDQPDIIEQARQTGIAAIINPGIDIATSQEAVALSVKYEFIYAAVGVHPHEAKDWNDETHTVLDNLAIEKKVVAIGEIGLDYYRDRAPRNAQIRAMETQLAIAAEKQLPVIIHNRDADLDVMDILETWQKELINSGSPLAERPGVLHSFAGNLKMAERAIEANFFLGINGIVTFKNAVNIQELVKDLPLDHLLVETDAPFLAPHPHRGSRNEPSFVRHTAMKIAELKQRSFVEIAKITTMNAQLLFQIGEKSLA